jgi:hypothetical protein
MLYLLPVVSFHLFRRCPASSVHVYVENDIADVSNVRGKRFHKFYVISISSAINCLNGPCVFGSFHVDSEPPGE